MSSHWKISIQLNNSKKISTYFSRDIYIKGCEVFLEQVKDLGIIFFRIMTIIPLMIFVTKMMGKRSISQLPIFDFLIVITLGSIVGADLAVPDTPHLPTAFAVILIGILQILVSKWNILNKSFSKLIMFEPTIVIHDGVFLIKNLYKIRYTTDEILQMLRGNNIFDVNDVKLAIIESNGQLTVQKKPSKENVTIEDMGLTKLSPDISYPVIIEGELQEKVLKNLKLTEDWLLHELSMLDIRDTSRVFFATLNEKNELHVTLREQHISLMKTLPPIFH